MSRPTNIPTAAVHFERLPVGEIVAAIRRTFPLPGGPEFGPSPESIDRYLIHGGIDLLWHRIPDWEDYECGRRDISDEDFVRLLFSPRHPSPDETILAVTHECLFGPEPHGFSFRFRDLLPFVGHVYPRLFSRPTDFFQAADTVFLAERSKLLVMLHHGGVRAQFAAEPVAP